MSERWLLKKQNPELAKQLAQACDIGDITAQVLIHRGLEDPEAIRRFFSSQLTDLPDPFQLPGIQEAVDLLLQVIEEKRPTCLFGDYDVDGMTGCAILHLFLSRCGVPVDIYIPDRSAEGYGLSLQALEAIHGRGAKLVITIDNGTTAFQELQWARDHGMDTIVVDHHESPQEMPPCAALINPKHPGSAHPDRTLCSAGLAFNLVVALRAQLRRTGYFKEHPEPNLKELLDLVCLGTVADMVPLQGQNRLLVRYGLLQIDAAQRPGIAALKDVAGVTDRLLNTRDIGFSLAPRLNAAGRLADALLGVRLLTTENVSEARRLAEQLNRLNDERRLIESQLLEAAIEQVEAQQPAEKKNAIVVAAQKWHPGVMGIAAARLTELYERPVFVIALQGETGKGSARSFGGVDLYAAMQACADHLLRFGGHRQAAGLSIQAEQVAAFRERLQEVVAEMLPAEGFHRTFEFDSPLSTDAIEAALVTELEGLSPFGIGNPQPLFLSEPVRLLSPNVVGKGHLRVQVAGAGAKWPAIGFGLAEHYELADHSPASRYELAYRPTWNEYRGERSIQLNIQSFRRVNV